MSSNAPNNEWPEFVGVDQTGRPVESERSKYRGYFIQAAELNGKFRRERDEAFVECAARVADMQKEINELRARLGE